MIITSADANRANQNILLYFPHFKVLFRRPVITQCNYGSPVRGKRPRHKIKTELFPKPPRFLSTAGLRELPRHSGGLHHAQAVELILGARVPPARTQPHQGHDEHRQHHEGADDGHQADERVVEGRGLGRPVRSAHGRLPREARVVERRRGRRLGHRQDDVHGAVDCFRESHGAQASLLPSVREFGGERDEIAFDSVRALPPLAPDANASLLRCSRGQKRSRFSPSLCVLVPSLL